VLGSGDLASKFKLEILTPERLFLSKEVDKIVVNTRDGELGVLKGHIPMVTVISIGSARITIDDTTHEAVLSEGFMEINRNGVIILVDTAEWPEEIDIKRAEAAKQRALDRLHSKLSKVEYLRTQAALSRALARINARKKIL